MKRSWAGFGLLMALLLISLLATGFMTRVHEETALDLRQSAECALRGQWQDAQLFLSRAEQGWRKWEHLRSSLSDHSPVEEVEESFAALEIYRQAREADAYRAACAVLVKKMEALGDSHRLVWWNIF